MTIISIKKSKLQAYQQLKHLGSVRKECNYFEKKVELCNKNAPKPVEFYINRANEHSIKALKANYAVSELVAKIGKSHQIAEHLVKPAMQLVNWLLRKEISPNCRTSCEASHLSVC